MIENLGLNLCGFPTFESNSQCLLSSFSTGGYFEKGLNFVFLDGRQGYFEEGSRLESRATESKVHSKSSRISYFGLASP